MLGIFDAVKSFFEFVIGAVKFFVKLLHDLLYVLDMIAAVVVKMPSYLGFFPTVVISLFAVCLSVVVVYKVVGRD